MEAGHLLKNPLPINIRQKFFFVTRGIALFFSPWLFMQRYSIFEQKPPQPQTLEDACGGADGAFTSI
jgi:hypothetical protein